MKKIFLLLGTLSMGACGTNVDWTPEERKALFEEGCITNISTIGSNFGAGGVESELFEHFRLYEKGVPIDLYESISDSINQIYKDPSYNSGKQKYLKKCRETIEVITNDRV